MFSPTPWRTFPGLALCLGGVLALADRAHAADAVTVEQVRVGIHHTFKVGAWTPVRVDLKGGATRFEGAIEVEAPDEDGTPVLSRLPVTVEPGAMLGTVAYVRPGTDQGEQIVVRVRDQNDRIVTTPARALDRDGKPPESLDVSQTLIVTLGNAQGLAELPTLAAFQSANGKRDSLVVARAQPGELPGRWYGLDAASVVVVDTNDAAVLDILRTRRDMLARWVENGGHLVLAVASHGQEVRELLEPLLPALPTGTIRLNDLGELEAFAGPKTRPIPSDSMNVARLEQAEARKGHVLAATTSTPLVVRGASGFGRVTLVGLDVDQRPFADWKDKALFWVRVLDLHGAEATEADMSTGGGTFYRNSVSDLATVLHQGLDRPPGIRPIPFTWVAFGVLGYILLIGPGDYLFLRRIVKRMEWTWFTFPLIVVATSVLAYAAAYAWKGTDLKVMKVDAIDVDQTAGRVRGSSWLTMFSPSNHDYEVSLTPLPLSGSRPTTSTAGFERLISWFSPVDPRLGSGGTGRMSLSVARYRYAPDGLAEMVQGVRVPIWSTKSFAGRWSGPLDEPLVEADLSPIGSDRIEGSVTNLTDRPLKNAALLFGSQVYDQLGTIAPGATVHVDLSSRTRPLSGYLEERAQVGLRNTGPNQNPSADEAPGERLASLVVVSMFRDGMSLKTGTPPSQPLRYLDLTGQLALDRPMLLATLDGPAADLRLDMGAKAPQVEQTTVLRIILKPKPAASQ